MSLGNTVADAMALQKANQRAAVDVSLMKMALDLQKNLGAEIAAMAGLGSVIDLKA